MDLPEEPALGTVLVDDRGSLPFSLLHGESLVAVASWALGESGVTLVDFATEWAGLVDAGEPVVLHDSLCPGTPPGFIASCVSSAVARDEVVVAVRPVTDTVKRVHDGLVEETLDRDGLTAVVSPVVLPARVVAGLDGLPDDALADLTVLAAWLRERVGVHLVEAPASALRVRGPDDVRLLEALLEGADEA